MSLTPLYLPLLHLKSSGCLSTRLGNGRQWLSPLLSISLLSLTKGSVGDRGGTDSPPLPPFSSLPLYLGLTMTEWGESQQLLPLPSSCLTMIEIEDQNMEESARAPFLLLTLSLLFSFSL